MATESSERCRLRGLCAGILHSLAASGENMITSLALSMLFQGVIDLLRGCACDVHGFSDVVVMSETWVDVSRYLPCVPENLAHRPQFTTLTSLSFDISFISYNKHFSITGLLRLSTLFVDMHKTVFQLERPCSPPTTSAHSSLRVG